MPPLTLMIKPASSLCNMRCAYCFYRDVAHHRDMPSHGIMAEDTLDALVRRAFAYADGQVRFLFQGGEPTLAGLPFYQRLVDLQAKYNSRRLAVENAIQTNGLALDDAFARFFREHGFLVGLSMDGSRDIHDALRRDSADRGTYAQTQRAADLLRTHNVPFNILCVVTAQIAAEPNTVFDALSPYGFLQFIPCLDGFGAAPDAYSLTPALYGDFLIKLYDRYERAYRRGAAVSIRLFDNLLQMLAGYPPEHCGMAGVCALSYVIEGDGGVYPCDFYVLDEWRIGNIREDSFMRIARSPIGKQFIDTSKPVHPDCMACNYYALCKGGCRREREPLSGGIPGKTRLCEGYRAFFDAALPRMRAFSRMLWKR